ncbi:substrate-binding periplasmic protein [Bdellovibrio sp. GT3]|uniref:substrate-binding periplasmic protein n=1 Tax=Bdellovibrio sp. GT3 TaxID=3136282 RepID=UPI0030F344BC
MKNIFLVLLILFTHTEVFADANPTFIFGVNSDYAMPLVKINRITAVPTLEDGILKQLGEALAEELGVTEKWFLVPKQRVAPSLVQGKIDILCHLNEVWQKAIVKDVWWTDEIYRSSNGIVYFRENPVTSIEDLKGESIGSVLNFVYPALDPYFTQGTLKREDGPNNQANIQKLLKKRLKYVVMSNIEFAYYSNPYPRLRFFELQGSSLMTKCAISKKSKLKLSDVNKAIATIIRNGKLSEILRSFYIKDAM